MRRAGRRVRAVFGERTHNDTFCFSREPAAGVSAACKAACVGGRPTGAFTRERSLWGTPRKGRRAGSSPGARAVSAKDVTRGGCVVTGRVARLLRRAGVIEVSATGANTAREVERME